MKFLITFGLLLSLVTKASITHQFTGEAWAKDCNVNQAELSRQSQKKALEGAIQECGAEPSRFLIINKGILWSPHAYPGEACRGILSFHTIEFSCPNDQFRIIGISMDGSFEDAKVAALIEAKKLCSGAPAERLTEWVVRSIPRQYWFEYRASALFKCL